MTEKTVNIGCAAGMWGDSLLSTPQLLATKRLHYLVYESLAEITMAILTRARQRDPSLGYATDIIQTDLARHLGEIKQQGVRVITNAGGINPQAAAAKLKEIAAAQGITLKVAVVMGDDLLSQVDDLREMDLREMGRGTAVPDQPIVPGPVARRAPTSWSRPWANRSAPPPARDGAGPARAPAPRPDSRAGSTRQRP
jgi:hypothetical protein